MLEDVLTNDRYAKMQHQANPIEELQFDDIVPPITSTRHVASAGFYHCLGENLRLDRIKF